MTQPPSSLSITQTDAAFRGAIKRVTAACRSLVIALLDDSDMSDEQVSLLYTSTVKAFYETVDEYTRLGVADVALDDLRSFPDALRTEIELIFSHSHASNSSNDPHEMTISGEEINLLISRLILSLQEKAKSHLALSTSSSLIHNLQQHSLPPAPVSQQPRGYLDNFGRRSSAASLLQNSSVRSRSGTVDTPTKPNIPTDSYPTPTNPVTKLYLQVGHEVKRVSYVKPALDYPTLHSLFRDKFRLIPSVSHFPSIYIQDQVRPSIIYELEDLSDIYDGCLLQLKTAHLMPPTRPAPPVPVASKPTTVLQNNKAAEIRALRSDLYQLRSTVHDQVAGMRTVIQGIGEQVKFVLTTQIKTEMQPESTTVQQDGTGGRRMLEHSKSALNTAIGVLNERIVDLDDLVESVRQDMVSRGSVPNQVSLDYATTELNQIQQAVAYARSQVEQNQPAWRTIWENDLKRVVHEQENFETVETMLEESTQRLEAIEDLTQQLSRVMAIALANPRAVIPRPRVYDPTDYVPPMNGKGFDGHQSVLVELSNVLDTDSASDVSERRMRAARRTEKLKHWGRKHHRSDLYWELQQFAGVSSAIDLSTNPRRLRSTGGIEALERKRAVREREILADIYAHVKEIKSTATRIHSGN